MVDLCLCFFVPCANFARLCLVHANAAHRHALEKVSIVIRGVEILHQMQSPPLIWSSGCEVVNLSRCCMALPAAA